MMTLARLLAALGIAVATGGCSSSSLLWYGHTPDRARRIEVRASGGGEWLSVAGRRSASYDAIALDSIAIGETGSLAFAARRRDASGRARWHAVRDLVEGPAWDGVAALGFGPRGSPFVYAAERRGRWRIVVEDRAGPAFDDLDPSSIAFSPDGSRVGYVAYEGSCARAVVDHDAGGCQGEVLGLALAERADADLVLAASSPDGSDARLLVGGEERARFARARSLHVDDQRLRWAVVASEHGAPGFRLHTGGEPGPSFEEIGEVAWAPGGRSVGYRARRGKTWFVVVGTTCSPGYGEVEPPAFSSDGRRSGFIGRTGDISEVVVDGRVLWRKRRVATALELGPRGRSAWVYRGARGPMIAVDAEHFRYDVVVERSLRFSRDGRHWAALVGSLPKRKLFIAVDGRTRLPFDSTELFGGGVRDGDVGAALGRWVAAELERYLQKAEAT